nr:MAG TPA: hypothetical protein [Caudoviricetes sp.]
MVGRAEKSLSQTSQWNSESSSPNLDWMNR